MSPGKLLAWYTLGGIAATLVVGPGPLLVTLVALGAACVYCSVKRIL